MVLNARRLCEKKFKPKKKTCTQNVFYNMQLLHVILSSAISLFRHIINLYISKRPAIFAGDGRSDNTLKLPLLHNLTPTNLGIIK